MEKLLAREVTIFPEKKKLFKSIKQTTKSTTRAGVYETLCSQHMLAPKDNL